MLTIDEQGVYDEQRKILWCGKQSLVKIINDSRNTLVYSDQTYSCYNSDGELIVQIPPRMEMIIKTLEGKQVTIPVAADYRLGIIEIFDKKMAAKEQREEDKKWTEALRSLKQYE